MSDIQEDIYTKDETVDYKGRPAIRKKTGNWKACPFIIANECCERIAYNGMATNLVNYITTHLNMGNAAATIVVSNWSGTCYVMPLFGAFVADSFLGRYYTIAIFMLIHLLGLSILSMSTSVRELKPSCSNAVCDPTNLQTTIFFVALYMIALGTGGIKPCVSSFGADQFDENDESEKKSKSSFFNWFYLVINIGALIASTLLVWVQMNVGWVWGFGIPAAAMLVAFVNFIFGTKLYRIQKPGGSPLTRIAQVIVASFRKFGTKVPENKALLYEISDKSAIEGSRKLKHTDQFSFLDKAAVQILDDKFSTSPWRISTVTQIEEVKSIIRLLPICASSIVFFAVYGQMSTMFVLQGNTLEPHIFASFTIPSASLLIFDTLSVIIWVPIYAFFIVPIARKFTGNQRGFTQLTRMGIGHVISILAMLCAGFLERTRLNKVKELNIYDSSEYVPISIFWQVPQYFFIGAAEVFTSIGQLEFFYDQAPDTMRSMCSALSLTIMSLGSYLSTLLVTIVTYATTRNGQPGWIPDNLNEGKLHYFFFLLGGLGLISFLLYLKAARWFTYKNADHL
ncbi:putative peptide transporter, Protein NRT1/ PTR FAMILY 8.2 [Zostera marina]|uniref:Putative peptide transporter, Protein NRT1/ PTR FAMILY 8.2 n=1 Tax=Zostera marina TaxID=29655 RepID=A0A0K9NRU9_ZOSMR|nr:putative peptide transporter, Protein NRT1/ PTR FAMILY 8.2 [Zostera marina]